MVGEEILDWVNTVDRGALVLFGGRSRKPTLPAAPSTEEGEELADLSRPWEHPNFWPYIYRSAPATQLLNRTHKLHSCILRAHLLSASALLSLVASHPSPVLQSLAALPLDLLRTFPRSTAFKDEREFLLRLRDWRVQARSAVLEAGALFEEAESDPELGAFERAEVTGRADKLRRWRRSGSGADGLGNWIQVLVGADGGQGEARVGGE